MKHHRFVEDKQNSRFCDVCGLVFSLHDALPAGDQNNPVNETQEHAGVSDERPRSALVDVEDLYLPWGVAEITDGIAPRWEVTDADGGHIAHAYGRETMEYIANAVNSHASLTAFAEYVAEGDLCSCAWPVVECIQCKARAALAATNSGTRTEKTNDD